MAAYRSDYTQPKTRLRSQNGDISIDTRKVSVFTVEERDFVSEEDVATEFLIVAHLAKNWTFVLATYADREIARSAKNTLDILLDNNDLHLFTWPDQTGAFPPSLKNALKIYERDGLAAKPSEEKVRV